MKKSKTPIQRKQLIWALILLVGIVAVHVIVALRSQQTADVDTDEYAFDEPQKEKIHQPIPFDPNKADSLTLLYNGLKPWQIKNLMKYRAKGGQYRKPDDFKKLYGLTDSAYKALKPYIRIDSTAWVARRDSLAVVRHERDSLRHRADSLRRDSLYPKTYRHPKRDTIIELNSADTSDLQYIKGIGAYTANHIIWYRNKLGGYASPEQIREIEAIKMVEFDSILPHLTANTDSIHPLKVNYCSVEQLQRHPYLTFTQAKAIYTLRRNKLKLKTIDDLQSLNELNDSVLTKLTPYLSFEP